MQVTLYKTEDFEELIGLYKETQNYGGSYDSDRDTPERLEQTARANNLFVLKDGSRVLGSFMILDNPHSFWLIRFVVQLELGNATEVARNLFNKAQNIAKERGHKSVIVYTDNDDEKLNQRYLDLGCHKAAVYRCYWKEVDEV